VDQQIRVAERAMVLDRIQPARPRVRHVEAERAQHCAELPDVGANDEARAHPAARAGRQGTGDSPVFELVAIPADPTPNHTHGATGADRRGKPAAGERNGVPVGQGSGYRDEGQAQV